MLSFQTKSEYLQLRPAAARFLHPRTYSLPVAVFVAVSEEESGYSRTALLNLQPHLAGRRPKGGGGGGGEGPSLLQTDTDCCAERSSLLRQKLQQSESGNGRKSIVPLSTDSPNGAVICPYFCLRQSCRGL